MGFLLVAMLLPLACAQRAGEPAPDFSFVDPQGEVLRLSDFRGTPVVLNFWATWCPPCLEELPLFQRVSNALDEEEKAVVVILLNNNESPEAAKRYLEEAGIGLLAALDATREQQRRLAAEGVTPDTTLGVMRRYRVRGMPTTFFIDAEGVIQSVKVGLVSPGEASTLLKGIGLDWQP